MEFNEKLQEMRKQRGLTQEELAQALFVSRTAISKWESGRGYPNIDSLKAIAKFFDVTVDALLSGNELLDLAQEESRQKEGHLRNLVFGLLDISVAILFFLPVFGQNIDGVVHESSLLSLTGIAPYLQVGYYVIIIASILFGLATLVLQNCASRLWMSVKDRISVLIGAVGTLLFVISLQPYAATLLFVFVTVKVLMLIKWQ